MNAPTGIGARVKRKEDQRFLTGTGRYVDDLPLARATYAHFLRSPHAHAKIKSIDVSAAKAMPGGQPSITQPIEGPWLSPHVVTRNRWPIVLYDMGARSRFRAAMTVAQVLADRSAARQWKSPHPDYSRLRSEIALCTKRNHLNLDCKKIVSFLPLTRPNGASVIVRSCSSF